MDLKNLQAAFAKAILSEDSILEVEALCSRGHIHATSCIAIYRRGLEGIWSQTLANAYPVLQELVGTEFFELLARDYGRQFPSPSGDLHSFGADFPQFLRDEKTLASYPYFPAVAELEWQIHCAYYAADANHLGLPEFLSAVGDAAQEAQLIFHPAVALHHSSWASAAVWQAHQSDDVAILNAPLDAPSFAVISRLEWQVEMHSLSPASYAALVALRHGQSLAQALEVAIEIAGGANFDVGGELQKWFLLGVFSGYECKESDQVPTNA